MSKQKTTAARKAKVGPLERERMRRVVHVFGRFIDAVECLPYSELSDRPLSPVEVDDDTRERLERAAEVAGEVIVRFAPHLWADAREGGAR